MNYEEIIEEFKASSLKQEAPDISGYLFYELSYTEFKAFQRIHTGCELTDDADFNYLLINNACYSAFVMPVECEIEALNHERLVFWHKSNCGTFFAVIFKGSKTFPCFQIGIPIKSLGGSRHNTLKMISQGISLDGKK